MKFNFFGRGSSDIPLFAPDGLARLENYQGFQTAPPYPHLVLRDLFKSQALRLVLEEWPAEERDIEKHDDGAYVKKKTGTTWKTKFGPHTQRYLLSFPARPSFRSCKKSRICGV